MCCNGNSQHPDKHGFKKTNNQAEKYANQGTTKEKIIYLLKVAGKPLYMDREKFILSF